MNPRAIFFGFSFRHHGPRTAFRGLARALADQQVIDASPPWPLWMPQPIEWRLYWRWLRAAEYRLRPCFRCADRRVIHYFFPENTMRRAHQWKAHHALIATCHQPIERLRALVDAPDAAPFFASLRACDRIVVQCESQIAPYRELLPGIPIDCIPLGTDTDFFTRQYPYPPPSGRPRILTVGNWLRDYKTWAETVRIMRAHRPNVEFVVIANADTIAVAREALGDTRNTHFLSGLSDEELRSEYDRATIFFLPLTGAMANDALLEALAMGTPAVVTDLPATRDYAGDAAHFIPPGSAAAASDALATLLDAPDDAAHLSHLMQARARTLYNWPIIAEQYRALYRACAAPNPSKA